MQTGVGSRPRSLMLPLPTHAPPFLAASRPQEPWAVAQVTLVKMRGQSAEALHQVPLILPSLPVGVHGRVPGQRPQHQRRAVGA